MGSIARMDPKLPSKCRDVSKGVSRNFLRGERHVDRSSK